MYGSPSSSGPKKRGSKEGEAALAPYKVEMPTEEDFKQMYGTTASKLESSVKRAMKRLRNILRDLWVVKLAIASLCKWRKRKSRRKRSSKKGTTKEVTQKPKR